MALVITWKPGDQIFIGGRPLKFLEVNGDSQKVEFEGANVTVMPGDWVRLFPGCDLRTSYRRQGVSPRIQISAPNLDVFRSDYCQQKVN